MRSLAIDARMINNSGIGKYLRSIIPLLIGKYSLVLLGRPLELMKFEWVSYVKIIPFDCKTLSIKEQFLLPFFIPKCDIFWSPQFNIPCFPIRAKKRVVTIHDTFHMAFFSELSFVMKCYVFFMFHLATMLSNVVITVSRFSADEIRKFALFSRRPVQVVYNGVDRNAFDVRAASFFSENIRKKYALPEKYVLFVGNIKPHKNLKRLVKAFRLIPSDCFLVIVGKKEGFITGDRALFDLINDDVDLNSRVVFTGFVDDEDLPAFYQMASVFVFPSLYEGFGLPPLEAMACGCPSVVSNTASIPEICADASCYVDPESIDSIAEGINKVLADPHYSKCLIDRGDARVKQFSWEESARLHLDIFDHLDALSK